MNKLNNPYLNYIKYILDMLVIIQEMNDSGEEIDDDLDEMIFNISGYLQNESQESEKENE